MYPPRLAGKLQWVCLPRSCLHDHAILLRGNNRRAADQTALLRLPPGAGHHGELVSKWP
jgi:hypothetical protein